MSAVLNSRNINNNMTLMPTKFTIENHPTYKDDLEKVTKMMPVASFGSLSTLAGSDAGDAASDAGSNDQMVTMFNQDILMEDKEKSELVLKREGLVKALGAGNEYKLAKLMQLEKKHYEAETIEVSDTWAHFDYDSEMDGAVVNKRTVLVKSIGAGNEYKLAKLQKLEQKHHAVNLIDANDKWAHCDYDSCMELSA